MSKWWLMQEKVQCSPNQNLSNTTGSPSCHNFTRSQKTSSNSAARSSSESGLDHVKKSAFQTKQFHEKLLLQTGTNQGKDSLRISWWRSRRRRCPRARRPGRSATSPRWTCQRSAGGLPSKHSNIPPSILALQSSWGSHRVSIIPSLYSWESRTEKYSFVQVANLEAPPRPQFCAFFSGYSTSPCKLHYKLTNN